MSHKSRPSPLPQKAMRTKRPHKSREYVEDDDDNPDDVSMEEVEDPASFFCLCSLSGEGVVRQAGRRGPLLRLEDIPGSQAFCA
ncbi:hypothetical protein NMY22_g14856 [Coprinellus aureogranulatus]|nr:hypothetical protein NMY22_g14856 [Coprinellus aureogranulatus]